MNEILTTMRQQTGIKFNDIESTLQKLVSHVASIEEVLEGFHDYLEKKETKVSQWLPMNRHKGLLKLFYVS